MCAPSASTATSHMPRHAAARDDGDRELAAHYYSPLVKTTCARAERSSCRRKEKPCGPTKSFDYYTVDEDGNGGAARARGTVLSAIGWHTTD